MTKVRNTTLSIIVLILTSTFLAGISMFPTKPVQAVTTFPSDMSVVFVDPPNATANPGDTITISVKIFNLSNTVHLCDESLPSPDIWSWGESLPPYNPNGRFNYSLGNLYGIEIEFAWDSNILEYVNHTMKIPVETYPDGILHEPIIPAADDVDAIGGTYTLAQSRYGLGGVFNKPDDNATIFEMTFNVTKIGRAYLNITASGLAVPISNPEYMDFFGEIPHWVRNGEFQTSVLATRIQSLNVKPLDNDTLFTLPVIAGEKAFVSTTIANDGSVTDIYNLTLSSGSTVVASWLNKSLDAGESESYNYTIDEAMLPVGEYTVTAYLSVLHVELNETKGFTDQIVREFKVIGTPHLEISVPDSAIIGRTVEFTSICTHNDPNGVILNYTWTLWGPGETQPRFTETGESTYTFDLHYKLTLGEWSAKLWVRDNYGFECDKDTVRPKLLEFYQASTTITLKPETSGIFNIENIALIVIIIIVIAVAIVYLRRRSR